MLKDSGPPGQQSIGKRPVCPHLPVSCQEQATPFAPKGNGPFLQICPRVTVPRGQKREWAKELNSFALWCVVDLVQALVLRRYGCLLLVPPLLLPQICGPLLASGRAAEYPEPDQEQEKEDHQD